MDLRPSLDLKTNRVILLFYVDVVYGTAVGLVALEQPQPRILAGMWRAHNVVIFKLRWSWTEQSL